MPPSPNNTTLGNGVNLQPSYYNNGAVNFGWDIMQQYANIKSVRIEIEPDSVNEAAGWIDAANNNNYQVIATYHDCNKLGTNDVSELLKAANWWRKNYQALGGYCLINLMNEWGNHDISAEEYATAYNQAIGIVRTVYDGPLIIDVPGWGQDADTAAKAANVHNGMIKDDNIVLSAHIYPCSWNSGSKQFFAIGDIDTLIASGRNLLVGEFGTEGKGECDWSGCVDYASQKGINIIGWCWNGDGNGYNMVSPFWNDDAMANVFSVNPLYFNTIYNKL